MMMFKDKFNSIIILSQDPEATRELLRRAFTIKETLSNDPGDFHAIDHNGDAWALSGTAQFCILDPITA